MEHATHPNIGEFKNSLKEAAGRGIEFLDRYAPRRWLSLLYENPDHLIVVKARSAFSHLCHFALAFSTREDMKNSHGDVTFSSVERHLRDTINFTRKEAIFRGFCLPETLPNGLNQLDAHRLLDEAWEKMLRAHIAKSPLFEQTV